MAEIISFLLLLTQVTYEVLTGRMRYYHFNEPKAVSVPQFWPRNETKKTYYIRMYDLSFLCSRTPDALADGAEQGFFF